MLVMLVRGKSHYAIISGRKSYDMLDIQNSLGSYAVLVLDNKQKNHERCGIFDATIENQT